MKELQKIRAIVFDLDGTLLDTLPDIGAGSNAALRHSALPERSLAVYRKLVGNGIRTLIRRAVPEGTPDDVYEQTLAYYLQYYPEHCTVHTKFYPGIEQMLATLKGAGFMLGVLSNKTEKTAVRIIDHFFPRSPFQLVWGNNGVRPLKPDPSAGRLLCEELGVSPEELMYVGDGDTDMEFASRNGFFAAGVTWGYRDREVLTSCGADALVDSADQLPKLLGL